MHVCILSLLVCSRFKELDVIMSSLFIFLFKFIYLSLTFHEQLHNFTSSTYIEPVKLFNLKVCTCKNKKLITSVVVDVHCLLPCRCVTLENSLSTHFETSQIPWRTQPAPPSLLLHSSVHVFEHLIPFLQRHCTADIYGVV